MMHNGYCTFPIGSSYTWVNISKTGSQIFTKFSGFFGGSPVDLESVQISGSDSGILRGWEKMFDPSIYPLGGHGTPNFSLGVYRVSTLLPKFTPLRQKLGSWGAGQVFNFFKTATYNTRSDSGHALGPIIVFTSSYRGRNLLKKIRGQDFEFLPTFWRYGLPNFTNFLVNVCQKFTSASCEGHKG